MENEPNPFPEMHIVGMPSMGGVVKAIARALRIETPNTGAVVMLDEALEHELPN